MEKNSSSHKKITGRRRFLKQMTAGTSGLLSGSLYQPGKSSSMGRYGTKDSRVSFVTGTDTRDATYRALKPLEKEIVNAIGNKQVVIKANVGEVLEEFPRCGTDVNQLRGVLDFLKPVYDRKVIIAEGTANKPVNILVEFEKIDYLPLLKEYNIEFIDNNDLPFTPRWILDATGHPLKINITASFLDPNIYMISATRLKTHSSVIVTLSLKNMTMGSPVHHYKSTAKDKNEKAKMHSGDNRGLSYNMFLLATMSVQPDLAVLDGVEGIEGNGPWHGTPIYQGVALASTDWLAADRLGVELMGVDYNEVKYLTWCGEAGIGEDNLSKIKIVGPDYRKHIVKYKLYEHIDQTRAWIYEDAKKARQ
ncbi:DUF362 domain-containing protein [Candidatus Latescibacterota bacterium]